MKLVNLIFCALFIVVASAAELPSELVSSGVESVVEPLIINGENATEGQFPYQVSLRYAIGNGRHGCGGSIISSRFILTAGHCVLRNLVPNPKTIVAVVGALRLSEGGIKLDIDKILPHEEFSMDEMKNDIALLRTAEEIVFSETIQPIALPTRNLQSEENVPVILSGWGRNSYKNLNQRPDILQYTNLHTISLANCTNLLKIFDPIAESYISENNVCTMGDDSIRACKGDSGGPLVDISDPENKSVVGIDSWGIFDCRQGYPDAYTRVYNYVDWIHKTIEKQSTV